MLRYLSASLLLVACSPSAGTTITGGGDGGVVTDEAPPSGDRIVTHQEWETGYGGYLYAVYNPYLLRANGEMFQHLSTNPDEIEATKTSKPAYWGKWEPNGNDPTEIKITFSNGKTYEWTVLSTYAVQPGDTISGKFSSTSGGGNMASGGDVGVIQVKGITFDGDKFSTASTTGVTTAVSASSGSHDEKGTYELGDNTITLHFENGKTAKSFFYFMVKDKTLFGIGETTYSDRK